MTQIALIGEAWGESEERERQAFVGPSGYLLNKMLEEAGIRRVDCFLSNVFNLRPLHNKIEWLCGPKELSLKGYPTLIKGGYVSAKYEKELKRLGDELAEANPNIIIAFGNTAVWALLGKTTISKLRGVVQYSTHTIAGFKVLPTYHPAAIMRQWTYRPTVIADLIKAKRESKSPVIERPTRKIWIQPTLEDIYAFDEAQIKPATRLAIDIETFGIYITCIGFAPNPETSLVIPFVIPGRSARAYWPSTDIELKVWRIVRDILQRPIPKTFQNGLYDIAFLYRSYGIKTYEAAHDTMLLHHSLQPESLKGLGYLGSIYTDEGAWKQMREHKTTIKRED